MSAHPTNHDELARLTAECVMCGLCLPHCPSYRVSSNEGDSPRGRIALAASLGVQTPSTQTFTHLDRCLGCLSCAEACPARVDYGRIIDLARARLQAHRPAPLPRWLDLAVRHPRVLTVLARLRHWLPEALLRRFAPGVASTPRWQAARAHKPMADKPNNGRRVLLFSGCVGAAAEADTLAAAEHLLRASGYQVLRSQPACCGALHHHAGLQAPARALAQAVASATPEVSAFVLIGSGCRRMLEEQVFGGKAQPPVHEVMEFLLQEGALARLSFARLDADVAWSRPCSLGSRAEVATLAALKQIPGLHVHRLPDQPRCCGGAGSYPLLQPDIATSLRQQRLASLPDIRLQALLTSNIGCRGWLGDGLQLAGRALPVIHPARLLAEQLLPRSGGAG